jgi:hypothetical protein
MTTLEHHVLRSDPYDLHFFENMQDALELAAARGVEFEYIGDERLSDDVVRFMYVQRDGNAQLAVVNDYTAGVRYLIVGASDETEAAQIAAIFGERLPFVPLQELQEYASRHMDHDPAALIRLALGAGNRVDTPTMAVFRTAFQHPEPLVRFRAAEAAGLTCWPESMLVLNALTHSDPSPEVREMARRALAACREAGMDSQSAERIAP